MRIIYCERLFFTVYFCYYRQNLGSRHGIEQKWAAYWSTEGMYLGNLSHANRTSNITKGNIKSSFLWTSFTFVDSFPTSILLARRQSSEACLMYWSNRRPLYVLRVGTCRCRPIISKRSPIWFYPNRQQWF